ncbi:DUF397 domain-containing protein [Kitasatospora sp. NPDC056800]|uniref:DUF397 domain-containing protein n=1 Tax=Kitasatospora sp. NPDC056800 TaxID=3345948 RepID=UPI0036CA0C35
MRHIKNAATDVAGTWRKTKASGNNGNCVEFAKLASGDVAMRNSRDPEGPALLFTRAEIAAMLSGAKDGELDYLTA